MKAKVMTANGLLNGDVVYLTAADAWSPWLQESEVAHDKDGEGRLEERAARAVSDRLVVGPYLMDVVEEDGVPRPLGTREKIRAQGPSSHPEFSKQVLNGAVDATGPAGAVGAQGVK